MVAAGPELGDGAGVVGAVGDGEAETGAAADDVVDLAAMGAVEGDCIELHGLIPSPPSLFGFCLVNAVLDQDFRLVHLEQQIVSG